MSQSTKIVHKVDHRKARAAEYPSVTDQLDLLYKGFKAQDPDTLSPEIKEWIKSIDDVKEKFPKS
jgi:hypothetical protein